MTDREKAIAYFRNREAQIPMPGARAMYQEAIKALEQPEVIRCKDCKYWKHDHTCSEHALVSPMCANEFCSRAERRTDERFNQQTGGY